MTSKAFIIGIAIITLLNLWGLAVLNDEIEGLKTIIHLILMGEAENLSTLYKDIMVSSESEGE